MSKTYRKTSYYEMNDDEIKVKKVDKKHGFAVVPDGKAKGAVVDENGVVFETQAQKKIAKKRKIKKDRATRKNFKGEIEENVEDSGTEKGI